MNKRRTWRIIRRVMVCIGLLAAAGALTVGYLIYPIYRYTPCGDVRCDLFAKELCVLDAGVLRCRKTPVVVSWCSFSHSEPGDETYSALALIASYRKWRYTQCGDLTCDLLQRQVCVRCDYKGIVARMEPTGCVMPMPGPFVGCGECDVGPE